MPLLSVPWESWFFTGVNEEVLPASARTFETIDCSLDALLQQATMYITELTSGNPTFLRNEATEQSCPRRRASYFHRPLTANMLGSCNKLDVMKPHLCFDGASVIVFFKTFVLAPDRNGVVDVLDFVREDNITVLPLVIA